MLISTYEINKWVGEETFCTIGGEKITFKYPYTALNHYQRRDDVESHNTRNQPPIALEDTWSIKHGEIVFLYFCWIYQS